MEKTNYSLVKLSAGLIFTMFMMLCVLSCDKIDNPIRYGGGSSSVQQAVATVINVTGANPSDVTAALDAIVTNEAVAAAAAKGEPIKVTVAGSGVSTDATDQTITIPQANGANIEISFATAPTTSNTNPLEFTASSGAAAASGSATNILAIEMPATTGLVITIELPKTTVVLATNGAGAVTYNKITAKTATNTLIVNNGITIKDLTVEGGNVVIQGGEIQNVTIAEDQDVTFTYDGLSTTNKMTIGAGATVRFKPSQSEEIYPKIKTVIGDEGKTAKFYLPRFDNGPAPDDLPEDEVWHKHHFDISGIGEISKCKVLYEGDADGGSFNNVLFDYCDLTVNDVFYTLQHMESAPAEIVFHDCNFNMKHMNFYAPSHTDSRTTGVVEFNGCEFGSEFSLECRVWGRDSEITPVVAPTPYPTYTTTIKFTNCTKNGTPLTSLSSDELKNFILFDGMQEFHFQAGPPADALDAPADAVRYYIDIIFQIGDDKYVFQNTHSWTEEEPWKDIQLVLYNPE